MRLLFTYISIIAFSLNTYCQVEPIDDVVYTVVEVMPLFENASSIEESKALLHNYINKRLGLDKYEGKGTVYVDFIIDQDGKTTKIKVVKGINSSLDKLAILYVQEMPIWKPGEQRGKKVKVKENIGVRFR